MKIFASQAMRGTIWMVSSTILFSLSSVLVRFADTSQGLGAWKSSEFRFLVSIVVVLVLSAWHRNPLKFVNRPWLVSRGLLGGASVCIYFYAITHIGIAKASILSYTYPIWAGIFSPLLLKDRIPLRLGAAVVMAFGGLYFVLIPSEGFGGISWIDMLALFGGLLSGWAVLSIKELHKTDSSNAILFAQAFFGLLIIGGPAHMDGYALSPMALVTLLAVGLFASIGQLQMTYAFKYVGATEGSLLSMLCPMLNVIFGMLVFHEPVSMRALIGCAIVLVGCAYAAIPRESAMEGSKKARASNEPELPCRIGHGG